MVQGEGEAWVDYSTGQNDYNLHLSEEGLVGTGMDENTYLGMSSSTLLASLGVVVGLLLLFFFIRIVNWLLERRPPRSLVSDIENKND